MKISYAICVCNESKDLYSLISFLLKVKDPEDEVNILVDSAHTTLQVTKVLSHFKNDIVINFRDFDGKFATHRNYHFTKCSGDYIFTIDPDEMPREDLITRLKSILKETQADLLFVPRINICPGYTNAWLEKCNFKVNELGWINWPDMQGRITKNKPEIQWSSELHERVVGVDKVVQLKPTPEVALWHIKSIEKQDNRWDDETKEYVSPGKENLYDLLM
jgi:GT2 family glycosyltransferase